MAAFIVLPSSAKGFAGRVSQTDYVQQEAVPRTAAILGRATHSGERRLHHRRSSFLAAATGAMSWAASQSQPYRRRRNLVNACRRGWVGDRRTQIGSLSRCATGNLVSTNTSVVPTPSESAQAGSDAKVANATKATDRPKVSGPVVVVTGASQGVGKAVAERFAAAGYHVVLAARTTETLETAANSCRKAAKTSKIRVLAVQCDITSESAVVALRDNVTALFEDVRAVICNAGVCMTGDFQSHSMADFRAQLDVNFLGHVSTAGAFMPILEERASTRGMKPAICFVNSFGARLPLPSMTAYCSAKYALQGFADTLRIEAATRGVHVATVHPGVIRSDFRQRAQWRGPDGKMRQGTMDSILDGKTPGSKLITQSVDEVAAAVVDAVEKQRNEVIVGPAFQAMLGGFSVAKAFGIT